MRASAQRQLMNLLDERVVLLGDGDEILELPFELRVARPKHRDLAPAGFAPIAIGLALTLIHLISIPVTNTSVNPARSTGVALFVGDWAIAQLWLFWLAPIVGALLGALTYRLIASEDG